MRRIAQMVLEEGTDAAAEERIVLRLAEGATMPIVGYLNTDRMRMDIRKAQGRRLSGKERDGERASV